LANLQSLVIYNDYNDNSQNKNKIFYITEEINKIPTLRELVIRNVSLSQKFINFFKFPNLEVLDLSANSITGLLSEFYMNIPRMKQINLSSNLLKGQLESLMNLQYIEKVELQNNFLDGTIPHFSNKNLQLLDVRNNTLTGNFPVTTPLYK
jgi:Leucine-rich repeat (LRR) protein